MKQEQSPSPYKDRSGNRAELGQDFLNLNPTRASLFSTTKNEQAPKLGTKPSHPTQLAWYCPHKRQPVGWAIVHL